MPKGPAIQAAMAVMASNLILDRAKEQAPEGTEQAQIDLSQLSDAEPGLLVGAGAVGAAKGGG